MGNWLSRRPGGSAAVSINGYKNVCGRKTVLESDFSREDVVMSGRIREREYFCGWYFKCQSKEESVAVIPAVHTVGGRQTGSIQLITGEKSWNCPFPSLDGQIPIHRIHRNRPCARLEENVFSENGIRLNLHTGTLSATGSLRFGKPSPIGYDIMGPFCCIPFMECRHRVFSMRHTVDGRLQVNGKTYCFENGVGYIEGDQGRSFPKQYMWTQCCFEGGSLMLATAEIPLGPVRFTGVIGVIQLHGREYRLATYLGAKVVCIRNHEAVIRQGDLTMTVTWPDRLSHPLQAPTDGAMTRTIRENVVCRARYQLRRKNHILFDFETSEASFEYEYNGGE